MDSLSLSITNQPNSTHIEDLWELLKKGISTTVDKQSDYVQTTASCTAVSDMCGTIPYFKKTSMNLRSGPQNRVCGSTPTRAML